MEKHIKAARAHRALSWLCGVLAIGMLLPLMLSRDASVDVSGASSMRSVVMFLFFSGLAILNHFTAKGARNLKPWACTASKVMGFFMLLGIPFGTLIGIYLLANNDWRAPPRRGGSLADAWPVQTETTSGS
jgi:hypothetical protein